MEYLWDCLSRMNRNLGDELINVWRDVAVGAVVALAYVATVVLIPPLRTRWLALHARPTRGVS